MTVAVQTIQDTLRGYLLSAEVEPESIIGTARLDELDIDSIDVVNILTELKEKFGAVIYRTELAEISLDGLAALAAERAGR